jgi:hypothetical protein
VLQDGLSIKLNSLAEIAPKSCGFLEQTGWGQNLRRANLEQHEKTHPITVPPV